MSTETGSGAIRSQNQGRTFKVIWFHAFNWRMNDDFFSPETGVYRHIRVLLKIIEFWNISGQLFIIKR